MSRPWWLGVMIVVGVVACGARLDARLDPGDAAGPRARLDCEVTTRRCSRCHSLDRVIATRVTDPTAWRSYVQRMRLVPGSGIRPSEEPAIVQCLVRRSFGPAGLARLSEVAL